ncbi:MAG TPA: S41 family peptidase [Bacteroidales bacterium]|nr:S41 family peptidase [Bacteroidales bacterium]
MNIQNRKSVAFLPLIFAVLLVAGIIIGIRLSRNGSNDRLLVYPRADKINSILDMIEDTYVDSISRNDLEETAINSILKKLDPHSVYIPASELQELNAPLEGNFSGIGVQFNYQNDTVVVVSTIPGGPSQKVGILPGDRIVKVNDTLVAGVKLNSEMIIKRLKGSEGTTVKVSVLRFGTRKLLDYHVTRARIPLKSVDISYLPSPGIGYIKISKFAKTTFEEFKSAVVALNKQGMNKKLIIDLRGNGGGLLTTATDIADEFLGGKELIVFTKGKARQKSETFSKPSGLCVGFSVVLLIDEYSASASEVLAGALQDNDRATVIGRRSFGKGLVQEQVLLPDGSAIRLTIARYYTPTGRSIQKPYANGTDKYYEELGERISHGELEQQDSIHFVDSLKFTTPKGKVVYGGGGIMPDIFVPLDTSGVTPYYESVVSKGLVYRFAFLYSDQKRNILKGYKNIHDLKAFLHKNNILNDFVEYARASGIAPDKKDLNISGIWLENQLIAYIGRNFFDDEGFYPVIFELDNSFKKAIEVLKG